MCVCVFVACTHVDMNACMCVCMYVCKRGRIPRTSRLCLKQGWSNGQVCMYIYVCMFVCILLSNVSLVPGARMKQLSGKYLYKCMYVCMYVCVYVSLYVCMYACMHAGMYVCMHVFM